MLQKYDPRNEDIKVHVNGEIVHRNEAKVSVFDSVVQGGDAVWEGLRLYKEGILHLSAHLQRLRESAHAMAFTHIPKDEEIRAAIKQPLEANGMTDETHLRLTLTRGEKITSGMDPRLNQKGTCLIVLAEWKPLVYDNNAGIKVITSAIRRNGPQFLDSKIHHANLINNIMAKVQANHAKVDAAIMLDDHGFISELNDTNIFMIKDHVLYTPFADACLPGISRGMLIDVATKNSFSLLEKNISLTEFYNADFAFGTGTMGQLTPIVEADGRSIGNHEGRVYFDKLVKAYEAVIPYACEQL
jgi:branched-chain amino acid aminotransferase